MGVPLVSTLRKRAWVALPLLLAGSGVALLVEPASPATAATRSPAVQLCVLNVTCVNVGPTPSAAPSTTPPLLGISIGSGASTAPASVSVGASLPVTVPVKVPSTSVEVTVPASIGVAVVPSADPSSSVAEHVVTGSVTTAPAPANGIAVPSVVGSVDDDDASAVPSVSAQPVTVAAPSRAPRASAVVAPATTPPTTTAAVQAVAPTTVRPVAVSPKLIQHVVSHSVGGVLLLIAACLVFIGVEISADRRDPKLIRAAQKSEWLRFEDPSRTSGGVA